MPSYSTNRFGIKTLSHQLTGSPQSMDNYPDDIRNYDAHPQSPFYDEPLDFDSDDAADPGDYGDWIYEQMKDRAYEQQIEEEEQRYEDRLDRNNDDRDLPC